MTNQFLEQVCGGVDGVILWGQTVIIIFMKVAAIAGSVSVSLLVIFLTGIKRSTLTQATVLSSLDHHH